MGSVWGQAVTSHVHQARAFTLTSTSRAVAEAPSIEMGSYALYCASEENWRGDKK